MCDLAKFSQRYLPAPKNRPHRTAGIDVRAGCVALSYRRFLIEMSRFVSCRPLHSFAAARYELKQLPL
jgi:hypothetical protein